MTGKERLINVICSIIGVLIAILFLVLLCFIIDKLISKKANDKEIVEIYSVDLEANGKGNFVLGCGNYNEKQYYFVYQATDDGGKKLQKYYYDDVTIYDNLETDEQPYMDITYSWDVKMYLPKDSIIQKYDVNLK
ncbi:MAG: hypothetical protein KH444_12010 [Ruminococcus sp.]|nr:hypothetical protein [Ruminococcus sp.]OLA69695.1 MAG: hypothetical protein BHW52_08330 [Ruminococcus sp. 37_24]